MTAGEAAAIGGTAEDPAMEAALDRAAASCTRHGAQLTELRRQVLRLVLEAEQPIGAYALLDRLRRARRGAAPPTVYRALDFLLAQGLIHKVERLNAFIGCEEVGHGHAHGAGHPHQFLICRECGGTAEICDLGVAQAVQAAARGAGFLPHRTTVEVEGLCLRCQNSPGSAK